MTKYSREEHLQTVLKQLIHQHFFGYELEWRYTDTSLYYRDKELWMQLCELIPEVISAKR